MSESSLPDVLEFHGNGGSFPPHGTITASDHGPAVVVATWIMMCLMVLAVIARFGTRFNFEKDGVAICVACVLSMCQSVTVHLAANYGLGRHRENLNAGRYAHYSKAVYASQILKIIIYYLAKLSLALVFVRLTPVKRMRRILWPFILFLTLWTGAAIITHAVQCPLPKPWDLTANGCLNQEALYLTYGNINILTDIVIILLPVAILWDVQIKSSQKRAICSVFVIRIVVCIASALELASLDEYFHNADKPWSNVDPTIWGQVSVNLSIITACIPLMKPLFNMLQFSLIDSSVPLSVELSLLKSKAPNDWTPRSK